MASNKISDIDIPFYFVRKPGQGSIMIRIEGDSREQCEEILKSIEIIGDSSRYKLLKLDRFPKETTACIIVKNDDIVE